MIRRQGSMFKPQELVEWLFNEGGPSIRLRTAVELMDIQDRSLQGRLAEALLQTERVGWLLQQMDCFGPITRVDIRVLNEIHGMKAECLENVIARLLERGLRAGVPVFDRKMERLRGYIDHPLVRSALDHPEQPTTEGDRAVFIALLMASYFLRGGYDWDEVLQFVELRLNRLARFAQKQDFAIYLAEGELTGLPKTWVGKPILRPEMNPLSGDLPLPLIHDLYALAYLPPELLTEQNQWMLEQVVAYVMDDRYRSFPWGYGYLWTKSNPRTCYGCGWSLDLPDLGGSGPARLGNLILRLELLAHFPAARKTAWFSEGMRLLETFRTERGTYRFPPAWLREMKDGYYVSGAYMGLEENRKKKTALELESTFRMLKLKKFQ